MQIEEAKVHCEWLLNAGILSSEDEEPMKTVLNYIETMHKEFDRLEGIEDNTAMLKMELEKKEAEIDKLRNTNKDLLKKLRNRVKEVKKLTRYSLYKKEFTRLNKQLEKKEKVIDLMAEYIHNTSNGEIYDIVCKEECENRNCIFAIGDNKEQEIDCIKQYFYKKAEEK